MKKVFALGIAVLVLLVSLVGCDKENGEVNPPSNPANDPQAISNTTQNNILETYVATYVVDGDGEVSSTLTLKSNNEFALSGNELISHMPSGTYTIDNEKLLLTVTEEEVYVFTIDDGRLIFESGTWLENWVEQGTVFYLFNE